MRKILLLIAFLPLVIKAQVVLRGTVSDSATGERIAFCPFIVKGTTGGGITDDRGNFSITVDKLPATLVFTMTGYQTRQKTVTASEPLRILLRPSPFQMRAVTITADPVQTLHAEDAWNFIDFEFYDEYILSLVSMRGRKGQYLVLIDSLGKTVSSMRTDKKADSLQTDCIGNVHLFAADSEWQVFYDYKKLYLLYPNSREQYASTMNPCRCQLGRYYYFSFSSAHGQKLDYYYIDWFEQGKYQHFLSLRDSARIVSFNENYDIRYFLERRRLYQEYPEPVDSIVRHIDEYREHLPLSQMEQRWMSPIASPLAHSAAYVYIADPVDSLLLTFTGAGIPVDTAFFCCLRIPGWKPNELYCDPVTNELYGRVVGKDGFSSFVRIDPRTGTENARALVDSYPYISQPRVRGGQVYFLWKDPYSEQATKLRVMVLH